MHLDTTVPLWNILVFIIPLFFAGMFTAFKMWSEQKDHKIQIQKLADDQDRIKLLIETKNEKTLDRLNAIERSFANTKENLGEIKTLLNILIKDHDRKHE